TDGAHDLAAPSSFAAGPIHARHGRAPSSASCWPTSDALTAGGCVRRAPVDTALKALRLQVRLNLRRTVSAVRPDPLAGIEEIEHSVQLLTVVARMRP